MSSPGLVIEGVNGNMTQADCDRLHFRKNRPDAVEINGLPIEFPPYAYRPYPQAMYGRWSDEAKRKAIREVARVAGLDLRNEQDFQEAESRIYQYDTKLVTNDRERADWLSKGWADEPGGVETAAQQLEADVAAQAAHRNWDDRNLSDKAKAEALAVDLAREDFTPEIPETPIRRGPGRPPKLTQGGDHAA